MKSVCKGGTVFDGGCRHCRAIAAGQASSVAAKAVPAEISETTTPVVAELLPEGEWPKKVSDEPVVETQTVRQYFLDHARLAFLQGLSTTKVVDVKPLGHSKYEGVVVRSQSGRLIALIDCPLHANALYVFSAETPDWAKVAGRTKYELRTERPPEFLRKFCHSGDWQNRVTKFLMSA